MKTNLFFFSATGNSLMIARDLADKLTETQIYSIPRIINNQIDIKAQTQTQNIGLIFPVFFCGMPRILNEFIEKLELKDPKYIFAVCNGGAPFPVGTLSLTQRKLRQKGLALNAGFYVQMPGNYLVKYGAFSPEQQKALFTQAKAKIKTISEFVKAQQNHPIEKGNFLTDKIGQWINQAMLPKFAAMDQYFWTTDQCNGCKLCEQICPIQNLHVINSRPKWGGNCEHCLACIQWCPVEAIQYQKITEARKRYHHPEVSAKELF
ncbi:MAG TPA: EFR1 family ferrodoxin [Bacillota bacterium]|nr:EFR1 family ferrodoxin [Bacillota bacterium]